MIVVSDTSPINYLLAIGQIDLLPRLFGKIILPAAVVAELQAADAPPGNRRWLAELPVQFEIRTATHPDSALTLDAGECEAIALAEELHAAAVLMDEKKGRAVARQRGLPVVGTLGVLEKAAALGWLDLEVAFALLRQTNFFGSEELLQAALRRAKKT
ncbi:MAG: hypothetical protein RLZZ350_2286 [Verrucomicrobiota bacterium]|jgi:predicted nucleic acid-binding protein